MAPLAAKSPRGNRGSKTLPPGDSSSNPRLIRLAALATALFALLAWMSRGAEEPEAPLSWASAPSSAPEPVTPEPKAAVPPSSPRVEGPLPRRIALAPSPLTNAEVPVTRPPLWSLRLERWPDGAPIGDRSLLVFGKPALAFTRTRTTEQGDLEFAEPLLGTKRWIYVEVEGYEPKRIDLGLTPPESVQLVPTTGHYGRLVDIFGEPVAAQVVRGTWQDTARTIPGSTHVIRIEKTKGRKVRRKIQPTFLATRGSLRATAGTTEAGWYYLEPLPGPVLGSMILMVDGEETSCAALELALPRAAVQLPELVVEPPRFVHGRVVRREAIDAPLQPVPNPRLMLRRPGDLDVALEVVGEDSGEFQQRGSKDGFWVSMEHPGYAISQAERTLELGADGLRQAWRNLPHPRRAGPLTPEEAEEYFLSSLPEEWSEDAFPRQLYEVQLDPMGFETTLVLVPRPRVALDVRHPNGTPLVGAELNMSYGGSHPFRRQARTNHLGRASFIGVDRAFQPMLLEVRAEGYETKLVPIPVWLREPLKIHMHEPEESGGSGRPKDNIEFVFETPQGPAAGAEVLLWTPPGRRTAEAQRAWKRGVTDSRGRFDFRVPDPTDKPLLHLAAFHSETGISFGGKWKHLSTAAWKSHIAQDDPKPLTWQLEPAWNIPVVVSQLEADQDYLVEWEITPDNLAPTLSGGSLRLPRGTQGTFSVPTQVPANWSLSAVLQRATRGSSPRYEFQIEDYEEGFLSTQPRWSEWFPIASGGPLILLSDSRKLYVQPPEILSIGGQVLGKPADEKRDIFLVARSETLGDWNHPIDSSGTFFWPDIPAGEYEFQLTALPPAQLASQGEVPQLEPLIPAGVVLDEYDLELTYPRFDITLEWPEEKEED